MFINPQFILDQKILVPNNGELNPKAIQQNGIDISLMRLWNSKYVYSEHFKNSRPTFVGDEFEVDLESNLLKWEEVTVQQFHHDYPFFYLEGGKTYQFYSNFYCDVPANMCGWLKTRSTFIRNGIRVESGLYDSGFKGVIGGTIYSEVSCEIQVGCRIAQMVFASADNASMYNGQYVDQKTPVIQPPFYPTC